MQAATQHKYGLCTAIPVTIPLQHDEDVITDLGELAEAYNHYQEIIAVIKKLEEVCMASESWANELTVLCVGAFGHKGIRG